MTPLDAVGIDQNIQIAAQQLHAGVEACQGLLPAAQVRLDAVAGKAAAAKFLRDAMDALRAADDDHFTALFQQSLGHAVSQSPGAAGYNGFFPLDIKTIHLVCPVLS